MIKTEKQFRKYMKGKTFPFRLMLGLRELATDLTEKEANVIKSCHLSDYTEEQFAEAHSLLTSLIAKNQYIIMMTLLKALNIPEEEVDMEIHPEITYDRKTGDISVHRGIPDWMNVVNHWSVCFDEPNSELGSLSDSIAEAIPDKALEKSKAFMTTGALKKLNSSELKTRIFNMMM